jgi:dCMP deaminase
MKNKDQFYIKIALSVATASYCKRAKVGSIIVKDDNIISFGYNGTISGFENVCECNGVTKKEVLHAESNAITKCVKAGFSSNKSTMYITLAPCFDCAKLIIQSGIKKVVYLDDYKITDGIDLLKKANIEIIKIKIKQ